MLNSNRYPDSWVFSDDCPSPKNIPTWVDAKVKVKEFVDIFLSQQFFKKLIFWRYPEYAGASYFIDSESEYRLVDYLFEAEEVRYGIEDLALKGHLSVLFVPLDPDTFVKKVINRGHYGAPRQIIVGDQNDDDPLEWQHGQDITFLESNVFKDGERIFTFLHDAEYLYEIFR